MESGADMSSGVTVIAAEAPSNYHVAPRAENCTQVTGTPPPVAVSLAGVGSVGISEKKKRGRPRKYGPDGNVTMALSPMPISSSAPPGNFSFRPEKMGGGQLISSEKKQKHRVGTQNLDDWISCSTGGNFIPHLITVNTGEDVTMKIIAFSQSGPRAICVISAVGVISSVTLRQPNSSGGTLTYEGRFEILSLSGSFAPTEIGGSGGGRSGGMSISLASPDGRVLGGMLAGLLIAASPVQVVVGSFLPSGHLVPKPKKQKPEQKFTMDTTTSTAMPGVELKRPITQDPNTLVVHNQNVASSSTHQTENWSMMPTGHDSRKSTADINISLQGE